MSNTTSNAARKRSGFASSRWFAIPRSQPGAKASVVLFPHAGGGPAWYAVWGNDLPPEIELKVLHLPGRGSRHAEAPVTDLAVLIATLSDVLVTALDIPYVLYGHSLGALIAFEVAREIGKFGRKRPERLVVSGCPAPHMIANRPAISDLPEAAFIEELRRFGGTPPEVLDDGELLQFMLPSLRSDMALFESYILADNAPLDCPITALGGSGDKVADLSELEGWRDYTVAGFGIRLFDGDHFFIRRHRGEIARILAAGISQRMTGG